MTKIYQLYLSLLKKYGEPRPWPWTRFAREARREDGGKPSTPFEICIGAILTQNTNWQNVEKALANLKKAKAISVKRLATVSDEALEEYVRSSGFYKQKTQRIKNFCQYLFKKYDGNLEKLFQKELQNLRKELLSLKGIGPETADTILLYAGKKAIFVIDEYTRRFAKRHGLTTDFSYSTLQKLFLKNLPKSVKIYEDYHALIVKDGSRRKTERKISSPVS